MDDTVTANEWRGFGAAVAIWMFTSTDPIAVSSSMTATTSVRPSVPIPGRRPPQVPQDAPPRQQLVDRAERLFMQASEAADRGDVSGSAQLILEALDCERRAGGVGPQVLQLIKPRG